MANCITIARILISTALLFFPALSPAFFALYTVAGLTDMIDGTVARKTGKVTDFGAKLDTAADLALVITCLIKLLPALHVPLWLYIWIGVIALIKLVNVVSGFVTQKKLVTPHTVMNKVTGALLFILPFTLPVLDIRYTAPIVCAVAAFAAVQEGHYIRTKKTELYDA